MARRCLIVKSQREPKFAVRKYNRCQRCFRRRAYYRKFGLCRLCLRELALKGEIPGLRKATW
ncbi:MAG: type Z 30S ribosomal protein S14 [candidate division WOR-3 bacterium]|nr:type Z 30S ribosomal protein S14 [candidate division WOR-3 bacterium]